MKQQINGITLLATGWFLIIAAPFAFYFAYIWYYTYGTHSTLAISLSDTFRSMLFVAAPFFPFIGWDIVKKGRMLGVSAVRE